ncbi:MAG: hypothetical protein JKX73_09435 [Flavobacteriales bacterium]|nr:hypothetical protein [Flavobacteriales bacterium]
MKKINAIFLALLLVLPTFGIAIEKHFCGGRLADVALFGGAGCGCDDENETDDCCHEENQVFRMSLDQIGGSNQRVPEINQQDLLSTMILIQPELIQTEEDSRLFLYDLPPPKTVPSYLLNCSFIFYG